MYFNFISLLLFVLISFSPSFLSSSSSFISSNNFNFLNLFAVKGFNFFSDLKIDSLSSFFIGVNYFFLKDSLNPLTI